jgi:rod shape-determining protein MreD
MLQLRRVPLVVAVVVTQVALFPQLRMLGVVPDLGLLCAIAVALDDGPEAGAWFGFGIGLGVDLFLSTPLGLSALAYGLTAYVFGTIHAALAHRGSLVNMVLGAAGGLLSGLVFIAAAVLTGVDGFETSHSVGVVARASIYDALLAPAAFALVRLVSGAHHPARDLRP